MFDINTDLVDILLFRYYFNWLISCVSLVKQYLFLKIVWISVKDIISKRNSEKHEKAWKEKRGGGIYHINAKFQNMLRHRVKKEKIIAIVKDKDGAFDCVLKAVVSLLQSLVVQQIRFPSPLSCMVVEHDEDSHPTSSLV